MLGGFVRIHKLHPGLLPAATALFLDVDGTLIEFGPAPDDVVVDAATLKFLQDASDTLGGALALPQSLVDELGEIAERHPGVLLEDKGRAVALHYRQAASLQEMLEREVHALARRHGGPDLQVQPGAYVLELKPSGITKAHAIEAFMQEPPFSGRTPLFAGDDLTDLHGFDAVERLGGVSIAVGPRVSAMIPAATPTALRALLEEFLAREAAA
jgi:trehalose 6-phosphate phosphatase